MIPLNSQTRKEQIRENACCSGGLLNKKYQRFLHILAQGWSIDLFARFVNKKNL
jgi:hypothetical protein